VIAADLNGDGDVDLATANTTNSVSVLLNDGGPGCPFDTRTYAVGATQHAVAAADMNKDGHLDLAFANIALFDWQPDGSLDLSDIVAMLQFLFFSAEAHALAVPGAEATECVAIVGCSSNSTCP